MLKKESAELVQAMQNLEEFHDQVEAVIHHLKEAFLAGGHVYTAGNGGSAAEAQHLAEEFIGRYKGNRAPYPAVALTADGTALTCIANDFGYEHVFRRQIEALGREGDVFVALSTSGNSPNIILAAEQAHQNGMTVIALTGQAGKLKDLADYVIAAPDSSNSRIQEMHLHAIHLICQAFEE